MNKIKFILKNIRSTVYKSKINVISYVLINVLLTASIILTNVIFRTTSNFINNLTKNNVMERTFFVTYDYKNQKENDAISYLQNLNEHIVSVVPQESLIAGGSFKEFQSDTQNGYVNFIGCNSYTLPDLTSGNTSEFKDGCCIIPEKFFPDSHIEYDYDVNDCLDGKKYIGKTLTLEIDVNHMDGDSISIIDKRKIQLKIVGTYDSFKNFNDNNECYLTFNDAKMINEIAIDNSIEISGYSPLMVIVDNEKNNNEVVNIINNGKYHATPKSQANKNVPNLIKAITDGICISVYCFSLAISLLLLLGMIKKAKNNISLMKTLGYTNYSITKLFFFGFIILIIIGYGIGYAVYHILSMITNNCLIEKNYFFSKMQIISSPIDIIFPLIPILIIPLLMLIPISCKIGKISPLDLWKSDKK